MDNTRYEELCEVRDLGRGTEKEIDERFRVLKLDLARANRSMGVVEVGSLRELRKLAERFVENEA